MVWGGVGSGGVGSGGVWCGVGWCGEGVWCGANQIYFTVLYVLHNMRICAICRTRARELLLDFWEHKRYPSTCGTKFTCAVRAICGFLSKSKGHSEFMWSAVCGCNLWISLKIMKSTVNPCGVNLWPDFAENEFDALFMCIQRNPQIVPTHCVPHGFTGCATHGFVVLSMIFNEIHRLPPHGFALLFMIFNEIHRLHSQTGPT